MKNIIFSFAFVLLVACFGKKPEKTGLEGKELPAFSILLPDSSTWFNTASIPAGKPAVLYQFSPYCPYCKKQMKEIIEDMDKLKGINFYLITRFPFKDMKVFYEEYQLSKYANITTGRDTAGFAADYFEAMAVPYTAVYDKNKKLQQAFVGPIYSKQILAAANADQ